MYSFDALADKDELVRYQGQKVKIMARSNTVQTGGGICIDICLSSSV